MTVIPFPVQPPVGDSWEAEACSPIVELSGARLCRWCGKGIEVHEVFAPDARARCTGVAPSGRAWPVGQVSPTWDRVEVRAEAERRRRAAEDMVDSCLEGSPWPRYPPVDDDGSTA